MKPAPVPEPAGPSAAVSAADPQCCCAGEALAAFERQSAEHWRCTDILSSTLMPLLTLVLAAGPAAARAAACLALALPGALALLAPARWFFSRRNWIVSGSRLASILLLARAVPPVAPPGSGWPGGLKLLVLSRCLSLNLFAWANRLPMRVSLLQLHRSPQLRRTVAWPALQPGCHARSPPSAPCPPPFQWLVWVHLAGTLEAARICLLPLRLTCFQRRSRAGAAAAPGRCGTSATPAAAHAHGPDGSRCVPSGRAACRALQVCTDATMQHGFKFPPLLQPAAGAAASRCTGTCLCQQVALWLLACLGFALPIMTQLLSQTAARHAFVRRWVPGTMRWREGLASVLLQLRRGLCPLLGSRNQRLSRWALDAVPPAAPLRPRRHCRCTCFPRCQAYMQLLAPDLLSLRVTAPLLFVAFCAAAWQASSAWAEAAAA